MGRDKTEATLIAAMVLCTLAQAALTVWLLTGQLR